VAQPAAPKARASTSRSKAQAVLLVVLFAAAALLSVWLGGIGGSGKVAPPAAAPAELQAKLAAMAEENAQLKRQLSERSACAADAGAAGVLAGGNRAE
jgi:hypothetical protein